MHLSVRHTYLSDKESYKGHLRPSNNSLFQTIIGQLAPAVLEDLGQPFFLSCQVMSRY